MTAIVKKLPLGVVSEYLDTTPPGDSRQKQRPLSFHPDVDANHRA